jgi:hypothetical protein
MPAWLRAAFLFSARGGIFLPALLLLNACDKGSLLPNRPPETQIFLDSVGLSGENRLNSVIRLHWSGEDQDGYVKGFEISINGSEWAYARATDSLFRFDIPPGSDTADIRFEVRALDNLDARDPSPAFLRVPIRNSPPSARFDTVNALPDTVLTVWSLLWAAEDLDGFSTLDSVFLRINDGAWVGLSPFVSLASFVPEAAAQPGPQAARLYLNSNGQLAPQRLEGLVLGGANRMYLRARDIAGVYSPTDSTPSFFLRPQRGSLLVIDDHGDATADPVYRSVLQAVVGSYDRYNLKARRPAFWEPTFRLLMEQYSQVFWYSDGAEIAVLGQQLHLEVGAGAIQQYLNGGGKLFISTPLPNAFSQGLRLTSPLLGYSPIDSFSRAPGQARIANGGFVYPLVAGPDTLVASAFITGADPFYAKDPTQNLFRGGLTPVGGWSGPDALCGRTRFANGKTNQVFFSAELHKLNGDPAALESLFRFVLLQELNW